MDDSPLWVSLETVDAIHLDQINTANEQPGVNQHPGVKDIGLVESAVMAPQQAFEYEKLDDILALGIRLGLRIAMNHGYVDGNKRTGSQAMNEFLFNNGYILDINDDSEDEPLLGILFKKALVGELTEAQLYDHLFPHLAPWPDDLVDG